MKIIHQIRFAIICFALLSVLYNCKKKDLEQNVEPTPVEVIQPKSELDTSQDSLNIVKTSALFKKFKNWQDLGLSSNSQEILLDSVFQSYQKVAHKTSDYAYELYRLAWDFYMDRNNHEKTIASIEEFIAICEQDKGHNKIQLLEAYSYLGSALNYSGQCDLAIEKSFIPFLELMSAQVDLTTDPDELGFLKTGEISTYVGYLDCASLLGDGNLQKKILAISEKLVEETHDDIPWYNVYKSDLLGMMSTIYMTMGDFGKAKIFLELYEKYMEPQDIIDHMLLTDRKLYFYSEVNDVENFNSEFKNSSVYYIKALQRFPPNTHEHFLAVHNRRLAFERLAMLKAKTNEVNPEISEAYHKSMRLIDGFEYDNRINPLNAYRGMISYFNSASKRDSARYYLNKYRVLANDLKAMDDIRDAQIFYLEQFLSEEKYNRVDSLLNNHLEASNIKNIQKFLSEKKVPQDVLANEKTIARMLKIATLLQEHSQSHPSYSLKKANQFYLLSASLLNAFKQNQWFNPKEVSQLQKINAGILSTRTAGTENDHLIIKFLESNHSLEMLQKNANSNIILNENDALNSLTNQRNLISRKILNLTNQYLQEELNPKLKEQNTYIKLLNKKDSLSEKIKEDYPDYVFYTSPNFDLSSYRANLDDDTISVRFYLTEKHCYAYLISNRELKFVVLGPRENVKNLTDIYISQIKANQDISKIVMSLNSFLTPLVSGIEPYRNLRIIPHEELNYLPFETFFDEFSKSNKVISYNTSLILDGHNNDVSNSATFAAYAPNYNNDEKVSKSRIVADLERSGNYQLPDAFEEAVYISKLFKGTLFADRKATKQHFTEHANEFSVLHLAMHAVEGDSQNNKDAMLLFTGETEEDYLSLNEVYNLNLSAELTTLSACNTAYGEIDPVEGVLSLSRAFQYAGSKATVTSLWRVPDKETSIIMKRFYEYLKLGQEKHIALKNAKLDYLKTTDDHNLKHPYYWAGFVLTGDTSAIVASTNYWWYVGLVLVVMLILGWSIKKRLKVN
ncbi:CHAT domain-containing protein [Sediminibacter sp. Hel_I_10]|uniref:CHAT domain-containing protein n=1 Tax=Sediminibacter sp. Hel_I_10 TaxID=1392490 RepID=UPI00047E6B99|nr:CHAT domain-containing protein [Sediminibacter sp. Hel_I_10]